MVVYSAEEACNVYYAAKKYDLPKPLKIAQEFMLRNANLMNLDQFYDIGKTCYLRHYQSSTQS